MKFIIVDSTDPYSPGDWEVFRSHADAQLGVEPDDAHDPLIHIYDEEGNWYRIVGKALVLAEDLPKADLARVDAMLALKVREHVGEPAATISEKLDQLLACQEAPKEKHRPPLLVFIAVFASVAGVLWLLLR